MGIFGWSYPPGCHSVPGDEDDGPCLVCGQTEEDCICLDCPECGSIGNPECYEKHGLARTEEQVRLLKDAKARWAADAKVEAEGEEKLRKELDEYYAEMEKDLGRLKDDKGEPSMGNVKLVGKQKRAHDLTNDQLTQLVNRVQKLLYLDSPEEMPASCFWNPDKEWEGADTLEEIRDILNDYGLVPSKPLPFDPDPQTTS